MLILHHNYQVTLMIPGLKNRSPCYVLLEKEGKNYRWTILLDPIKMCCKCMTHYITAKEKLARKAYNAFSWKSAYPLCLSSVKGTRGPQGSSAKAKLRLVVALTQRRTKIRCAPSYTHFALWLSWWLIVKRALRKKPKI